MSSMEHTATELLDMDLAVEGNDWNPTPHGIFMANVLARNNLVKDEFD